MADWLWLLLLLFLVYIFDTFKIRAPKRSYKQMRLKAKIWREKS